MPIAQASFDNIKVGYISETDGYIQGVSLADAREYARLNPAIYNEKGEYIA